MKLPFLIGKRAVRLSKSFFIGFCRDGCIVSVGTHVSLWAEGGRQRLATSKVLRHPGHLDICPVSDSMVIKNTAGQVALLTLPTLEAIEHKSLSSSHEGCDILYSPCGRYLIDGSWAGELSIKEISTGEVVLSERSPGTMINWLSCTPDRRSFVYIEQPKAIGNAALAPSTVVLRAWPFSEGGKQANQGRWVSAKAATLSCDAKRVAVLHQLKDAKLQVDVLDLESRQIKSAPPFSYGGTNFSLAWSHDGRYLAHVGNKEVAVLNSTTLETVVRYEDEFPCFVAFSPTDEHLALGSWKQGTVVSTSAWRT